MTTPVTLDDVRSRPTITAHEAAQLLNLTRDAFYKHVREGRIPHVRFGRKVVVPTQPLLRMLGAEIDGGAK